MTRPGKILISTIAAVAVPFLVTNILLYYKLTDIIRKELPALEKKSGFHITLGRAWATLPSGTVKISKLRLSDPADNATVLSIKLGSANVGLFSMARGILKLSSVNITDAKLTLVKNPSGNLNTASLKLLSGLLSPESKTTKPLPAPGHTARPTAPPADASQEASSPPTQKTLIRNLSIATIVDYVDRRVAPGSEAAHLPLALRLQATDLSTFGDPSRETGTFSLEGHLRGKPDAFVINASGKIAPLPDPSRPTFDLDGTITNICTSDFTDLAAILEFNGDGIDLDIHIKCRNGAYDVEPSYINIKARNLELTGSSAGKAKGMSVSKISATLPLKGTFEKPSIDVVGALTGSLLGNLDGVLKSLNIDDKKLNKQVTKFLDDILGTKKK